MSMNKWLVGGAVAVILAGVTIATLIRRSPAPVVGEPNKTTESVEPPIPTVVAAVRSDLSQHNAAYQFSADLNSGWQVKYIAPTEAIALFPPGADPTSLDGAEIFIRHFEASQFLTLSTVNITKREETSVGAHAAVAYEIEKKAGVANFADQPAWRSAKHTVLDIRFAPTGQTSFFVLARNPKLSTEQFDSFVASLKLYNDKNSVVSPLDRISERVSKKTFGTKVSPTSSPVTPEKFSGYHTGWDFEIFPEELTNDVPVVAFCGGALRVKQTTSGYGGVVVQDCTIDGKTITALYGHLNVASVVANIGNYLAPGQKIGLLGNDKSTQTDGERKHLHFSIHNGAATDLRGYVDTSNELSGWLDPKDYLK